MNKSLSRATVKGVWCTDGLGHRSQVLKGVRGWNGKGSPSQHAGHPI